MFVLADFFLTAAEIIGYVLSLYMYVVIGRAVISWVNPDPYNPIVRFLYQATEPVLSRVRRFLPNLGGIDLSPLIVILAILFIKSFLIRLAYRL
jgi:YggT family protein